MMKVILSLIGVYIVLLLTMYVAQEKLIFFPQKLKKDHAFHFPSSFEELSISVGEETLHALAFDSGTGTEW